ncbi:MAG: hypothetical protein ABL907_12610 [Hyphomicrobium sp.]
MSAAAQKRDRVETEAGAAASEAANVAREEVYEKTDQHAPGLTKLQKASKAATEAAKSKWHEFTVDVWITPFNTIEFGFWKKERNKGKSRQFTTDMDVFAEIIENGERTGVLGYRKELWNDATGMDKRLVFKLFSDTLNWRASMDLMLARSIQQTIGARGVPVTTYSINTYDDDYIVYLERSANKWPFCPEHFSFFIMEDGAPRFYRLTRDIINIGGDYTLIDQHGETVGHIDGAILTIGGQWNCTVRGDHADPRVLMVMKMFAGMLVFNKSVRAHVKALAQDIAAGRIEPDLQRQESDLYMNPRRVR